MKLRFLFLFLSMYSGLMYAQTEHGWGCHFRHQSEVNRSLTDEEKTWFRASVERSDSFDILDYELNIDLQQMSNKRLYGHAIVTFTPKLTNLERLPLDLLRLTVDSIKMDQEKLTYDYNTILLTINTSVLKKDSIYKVEVFYHGTPTTSPSGFGGFYFEDGIAYNLGIGLTDDPHNFGRSWFPCFDNFVERSTYTYRVTTPKGIYTFATGSLVSEDTLLNGANLKEYRMEQPIPTYLSAIAASNYTTYDYTYETVEGVLPYQIVVKQEDLEDAKNSFKNLPYAVDGFERWYGKYPFERVGYVMTSRGAMEHPNNIAYPVSSVGGGAENRDLMAHELCHLWWGDLTTLKTQADMWIKEGNAEYGAHLFAESLTGRESFESKVNSNRYTVITSAHLNDGGYLPLSPMPKDKTYGMTTYNKGAMVLHSLRGYLGDSLFKVGQRHVLAKNSYKNLTAEIYQNDLTEATGVDMKDFFDRWVLDAGFYDFFIENFETLDFSPYTHKISIGQRLYHASDYCIDAPVTVTFVDQNNQFHHRRFVCNGRSTAFNIQLDFQVKAAFLNVPMTLNLAQFASFKKINSTGNLSPGNTELFAGVNRIDDSTYILVEHHYTDPGSELNHLPDFSLSDRHFWKVTYADPEKIGINGRLSYSIDWDQELLKNGEDSIQLLFRENAFVPWRVYDEFRKIMGSATDKKGSFVLDNIRQGDYTFGNVSQKALSKKYISEKNISVFPSPTTGNFSINLIDRDWTNFNKINVNIWDLAGQLVFAKLVDFNGFSIDLSLPSSVSSGSYILEIADGDYKVNTSKVIEVIK